MLQGTVQLILCWNVDVIYVYPSLLHVTGYHATGLEILPLTSNKYIVIELYC